MLLRVLWTTPCKGFFLVCHMLWVILASFLFSLVRLQLANLFHQLLLGMLHRLQYLNKEVGIVNANSLLLLWHNPRSINTFHLIRLVRHGWPWFYLWWYDTHVSRRLWSWGHNLRGLYLLSLSFSQIPNEVANLNIVGFFCVLSWILLLYHVWWF